MPLLLPCGRKLLRLHVDVTDNSSAAAVCFWLLVLSRFAGKETDDDGAMHVN